MTESRSDGLEHQYDVIFVGTGLVQSILSSALTKVGKNILHYEKHEYYGGEDWPSFHLNDLLAWIEEKKEKQGYGKDEIATPAPILAPTPHILRMQWPKPRWRTALLNNPPCNSDSTIEDGDAEGDKEKKDGEAEEGDGADASSKPLEVDAAVPTESYQVPLLPMSYSTVKIRRYYEKPAEKVIREQEEGEGGQKETVPATSAEQSDSVEVDEQQQEQQQQQPPIAKDKEATTSIIDTMERLRSKSRDFNLDLSPVVLLAGGDVIEPLLSSGVANYLEFKTLQALYIVTLEGGGATAAARQPTLHKVPCSKTDVFSSKLLPAKEKRQLMKFLQFVADWGFKQSGKAISLRNETELGQGRSLHRPQNKTSVEMDETAYLGEPFDSFLEHGCKLDPQLRWVVTYALALAGEDQEARPMTTEEGLMRVFKHLKGLGMYGETAFLWPLYGSCDITQAFCRTSSVWGGTFILRDQPAKLVIDPKMGRCLGIVDQHDEAIACDYVVMGQETLPRCRKGRHKAVRRITLTDRPVVGPGMSNTGGVLPPGVLREGEDRHAIHFFAIDAASRCAPQDVYILYLATLVEEKEDGEEEGSTGETILEKAATSLLALNDATELWSVTFEQPILLPPTVDQLVNSSNRPPPAAYPSNLLFVSRDPPSFYLQSPLDQAKVLFEQICPAEAFLPAKVPEGVVQFANNEEQDQDTEILEATLLQAKLHEEKESSSVQQEVVVAVEVYSPTDQQQQEEQEQKGGASK